MIEFTVYVEPATQGSMKPVRRGGRTYIIHDNDEKVTTTQQAIAVAALASGVRPVDGPVAVTIKAYLSRGKSVKRKYPTVRPDLDKIERLVLDALKGIAWVDDSQVIDFDKVSKRYADDGPPRVEISIEEVAS